MVKIINGGDIIRKIIVVWILIISIIIVWVYFIFISPHLFNHKEITMPDIINLNEEEGLEVLKDNNINYQITYIESNDNKIISTIPDSNVRFKKNFIVNLYVGKILPKTYKSFLGLVYNENKELIDNWSNENNINVVIKYVESKNHLDGIIINESLLEGEDLSFIKELVLFVSNNKEWVVFPDFVGSSIDVVMEFVTKNNISIIFSYLSSPFMEGIVINQSVEPNTIVNKNNRNKIVIYVSLN